MGQSNSKRRQSYAVKQVPPKPVAATPPPAPTPKIEAPELKTVEATPEQSLLVPAWVNADNFHDVLVEALENYEKIIKFNARPALGAGENYATLMLRVTIEAQLKDNSTKTIAFMLKVPHDNEQMREMLKVVNFFDSENAMYFDVIPELEEMYKSKGLNIKLSAKPYKFKNDTGSSSVLLEDLGQQGYKNANRLECLNMEHCKCVLKKMAQFHAASATRIRNRGPFGKIIMTGFTDPNDTAGKAIFDAMLSSFKIAFTNNLKHYKDYELYEDMLLKRFETITDDFLNMSFQDSNDFAVLNHGDSWCNNILFKYADDGTIEDTIFVDYQIPKYGSPVQDLLYFIFSSAQLDIRLQKFDFMIRYYHEQLVDHLTLLGYIDRLPKLRDLHFQLLRNCTWALSSTIIILPVVLLDPSDNANLENFMGDNASAIELKNQFYRNPRYIEHINEVLPWLHNRAYLEAWDKPKEVGEPVTAASSADVQAVVAVNTAETKMISTERTPIPAWLTAEYFEDILKANVAGYKQIKQFNVKPGTSAGDNYASSLLAIDIEVELENQSSKQLAFMLKVSLTSKEAEEMLSLLDVFDKETLMYGEIIPAFEELYKRVGLDVKFGPKFYTFQRDPGYKTVLLENLRPYGYKNADRLTGLDFEHTNAVLTKIAQFHAASIKWQEEHGSFPTVLQKGMFNEDNREYMEAMMNKFYDIYLEVAQTYEGSEDYIEKLTAFKTCFHDMMMEANYVDPNNLNVLNHGDCWTNNFLFQYNAAGNIGSTVFVDYQMVKYGSAAQDLYYFLCSSPQLQIKLDHFDACIKYYYDELRKHLKLLSYTGIVPSLREFHVQLFKQGGWACSTITGVMAAVLLDPTEDASMEMWLSTDEAGNNMKRKVYSNKRYREHASAQLKWCNHRGLLDFQSFRPQTATVSIPKWVNADNFSTIIRGELTQLDKIVKLSTESATKPGENYASLMLRVNIEAKLLDGSNEHLAYVLKVPSEILLEDTLSTAWNFFPKERAMYTKFIPGFERLFAEAGQTVHFAPRYLDISEELAKDAILMEDLQKRGFKTSNRFEGFDLEHTKCVLRKMAQFHAASVRYMELNGAYPECMNIGLYNKETMNDLKTMTSSSTKELEEAIKQYTECQEFAEKLLRAQEVSIDRLVELGYIDANEFNVLNHGDCWINNIMFQYNDSGNITETLYVDFQVCKYGSPAHDLYFFLMSSPKLDIKVEKFDYFIKYYHDNLVESLRLLKYEGNNVPSLKDLHETLLKYGFMGVAHSLGVGALALIEPQEDMRLETFLGDSETSRKLRLSMYAGERVIANANVVYPWLYKRGLLDI